VFGSSVHAWDAMTQPEGVQVLAASHMLVDVVRQEAA
jgi:hypothetical protein